jgi:hypothetical protein
MNKRKKRKKCCVLPMYVSYSVEEVDSYAIVGLFIYILPIQLNVNSLIKQWYWFGVGGGLWSNSEFHACKAGTLPLDPVFFPSGSFEDGGLVNCCLGWPPTKILLISAS